MAHWHNANEINDGFERDLIRKCGGFSFVEIVVVCVVLLVLAGAFTISWVGFVRHQELRADTIGMHRDIMAQRARVVAGGNSSKVEFIYTTDGYAVLSTLPDDDGDLPTSPSKREVRLNERVSIVRPENETLPYSMSSNNWEDTIRVQQLPASQITGDVYQDGWIILESSASNRKFCIMMRKETSIKPEIYMRIGSGGWKRM